jgi:peptide/nickel transport system substrate-binding protein
MKPVRTGFVGALCASIVLLAGCGGGAEESGDGAEESGDGAEESGDGDSLTVVLAEEPLNLDATGGNADRLPVTREIFEPLVKVNTDYEIVPWLATDYEQDGNTWTMHLREGVTFTDGTPLSAEVVVDTFGAHVEDLVAAGLQISPEAEFEATGEMALTVTEPVENPTLMAQLAQVALWSPEAEKSGDEVSSRVGTGPYELAAVQQGTSITLKANENYWGGTPDVETVKYVFRSEGSSRAGMIKSGEADIAYSLPPQNTTGIETVTQEIPETPILIVNTEGDLLQDARVREAINLAIDRQALAETIFGGYAAPASQLVPEGTFGYSSNIEPWPHDPARAEELIAQVEADGTDVSKNITLVGRNGIFVNDAEAMNQIGVWLRDVGFNASVQMLDVSAWTDQLYGENPPTGGIFQGSAGAYLGDARSVVHGYLCPGSPHDLAGTFGTPELTKLCEASRVASGEERGALYAEIAEYHREVLKDPIAPLVQLDTAYGVRSGLEVTPEFLGSFGGIPIEKIELS